MKKHFIFLSFIGALLFGNAGWGATGAFDEAFDEAFVRALRTVSPFNGSLSHILWDSTPEGANGLLTFNTDDGMQKMLSVRKGDDLATFYLDLRQKNKTLFARYVDSNIKVLEEKDNKRAATLSSRDEWTLPVEEGCPAARKGTRVSLEEVIYTLPWGDMYRAVSHVAHALIYEFINADILQLTAEGPRRISNRSMVYGIEAIHGGNAIVTVDEAGNITCVDFTITHPRKVTHIEDYHAADIRGWWPHGLDRNRFIQNPQWLEEAIKDEPLSEERRRALKGAGFGGDVARTYGDLTGK